MSGKKTVVESIQQLRVDKSEGEAKGFLQVNGSKEWGKGGDKAKKVVYSREENGFFDPSRVDTSESDGRKRSRKRQTTSHFNPSASEQLSKRTNKQGSSDSKHANEGKPSSKRCVYSVNGHPLAMDSLPLSATLKEPPNPKGGEESNGEWDNVQFPQPTRTGDNETVLQQLAQLAKVSEAARDAITSSAGVHGLNGEDDQEEDAGAAAKAAGTGGKNQGNAGAAAGTGGKDKGNAGDAASFAGTGGKDKGNAHADKPENKYGKQKQGNDGAAASIGYPSQDKQGLLQIYLVKLTFDSTSSEIAWVSVSVAPTDSFGYRFPKDASQDDAEEGMRGVLIVHVSSRDAGDVPEYFALLDSQFCKKLDKNLQVPTRPGVFLRAVHDDNLVWKFEVVEYALLVAREVEKKVPDSPRRFKLQFAKYNDVDPVATERLQESGEFDGALTKCFKSQVLGPLVLAHRPRQDFFPFWEKEEPIPDDDLNLKLPPDPLRPEGQTTDSDDEGLYLEDSSNLADSELDFSSAISGASPPGTSPPGASKRGKQKRKGVRKPGRCSKKSRASLKPKTDSKSELTPGADTFEAAFVASALSSGRKARATTLPKYSPEILDRTCGNKGSEIEGMETPTVCASSGKLGGPAAKEGELFDGIKNPLFVFWGQDLLSYRPAATDAIEQAEKCQLWWGLGQPCTEGAVTNHAVGTDGKVAWIDLPKKLRMGQHGNLEEDNRSAGSKDSKGGKGSKGGKRGGNGHHGRATCVCSPCKCYRKGSKGGKRGGNGHHDRATCVCSPCKCYRRKHGMVEPPAKRPGDKEQTPGNAAADKQEVKHLPPSNSSPAPPGKPTGDEELTGDEEAPGALLSPEPPKPKPKPKAKPKHNARIDEEHVHDPVKCGGALECRECRGCGLGCKCPHCDPHSSRCECGRSTCPPVQRSAPSQQVGRPNQEPQNKRESSSDGPDDEMAPMMKMFSSVAGKMSNSKGGGSSIFGGPHCTSCSLCQVVKIPVFFMGITRTPREDLFQRTQVIFWDCETVIMAVEPVDYGSSRERRHSLL
eukprot:g4862.t1